MDGYGLEIGYNNGGVDLKLPLLVGTGLNFTDFEYYDGLLRILKGSIIFLGLNIITASLLRAISHMFAAKSVSNEELQKKRNEILENRVYTQKIIQHIFLQAEVNHQAEKEKGSKGLLIHLALYGNKKKLKFILNNFLYIKRDELKSFVDNLDNEVFDVTIPTRYLIKKDPKRSFSSILYHQTPKTKIIGYMNPIFSSDKKPSLLLRYCLDKVVTKLMGLAA